MANKPKSCKEFSDCIKFLKSRGIRIYSIWRSSDIVGRRTERNIVCWPYQIVETDDIPEGFEVVYHCESNGVTTFSYEDPIHCDLFYAMIFEKRERRTEELIPCSAYIR